MNENSKVNFGDVNDTVQELKRGKRDGFSGLMSDHVINACDELFIHISLLLSSVLVHGTPSDDLLVSTRVCTLNTGHMLSGMDLIRDGFQF